LRILIEGIKQIKIALIFGSYAKNKLNVGSDIDVLLVTSASTIEDEIIAKLSLIEQKIQREINYKIYGLAEFQRKRAEKDPFLDEILNDKYLLIKGKI
jgi:predicted nucleotidyltransferase